MTTSPKKYEQSNPVCLTDTYESVYPALADLAGGKDIETIYDDDERHLAIQNWPDPEKGSTVKKFSVHSTKDGENFQTLIKKVGEENNKHQEIQNEMQR